MLLLLDRRLLPHISPHDFPGKQRRRQRPLPRRHRLIRDHPNLAVVAHAAVEDVRKWAIVAPPNYPVVAVLAHRRQTRLAAPVVGSSPVEEQNEGEQDAIRQDAQTHHCTALINAPWIALHSLYCCPTSISLRRTWAPVFPSSGVSGGHSCTRLAGIGGLGDGGVEVAHP